MDRELYEAVQQWQQDQTTRRSVTIEFGDHNDRNKEKIMVYDYDVKVATYISSIEELNNLDMKAIKRARLEKEMEECA